MRSPLIRAQADFAPRTDYRPWADVNRRVEERRVADVVRYGPDRRIAERRTTCPECSTDLTDPGHAESHRWVMWSHEQRRAA